MLRKAGVVGKFVEYFGEGLASLPVADRATIGNMSPEYGATCGFFPVDDQTLAYLRLTGGVRDQWQDRAHFFRAAAEAMRCILIENARKKSRWKRGGRLERVELEGLELATATSPDTLLVVHEALARLESEDPPKADLVRLRFFIGLTHAETARVLGLSEPTVKRHWDFARAWLLREIRVIAAGG